MKCGDIFEADRLRTFSDEYFCVLHKGLLSSVLRGVGMRGGRSGFARQSILGCHFDYLGSSHWQYCVPKQSVLRGWMVCFVWKKCVSGGAGRTVLTFRQTETNENPVFFRVPESVKRCYTDSFRRHRQKPVLTMPHPSRRCYASWGGTAESKAAAGAFTVCTVFWYYKKSPFCDFCRDKSSSVSLIFCNFAPNLG